MFVLQVAVVKGKGGMTTAMAHYARMFREVGVPNACLFRGPSVEALRSQGFDVIEAPPALTAPIGLGAILLGDVRDAILARSKGERIVAIVHSDLALASIRRLFPDAIIVAPAHSAKYKHKRGADLVIALNSAEEMRLREGFGPDGPPAVMLGNPYVPRVHGEKPTAQGDARLNFCARFTDVKDPLAFLRAALAIPENHQPEIRLIGNGPLEDEVRLETASRPNVTLAGWLSDPLSAFHANDILVLPSHWEGLPYLLLEALDRSIPIVASDIPGNRAALGDGAYGLLYPLGDGAALTRAMEAALADLDGLKAKAEKGRSALYARYGAAPFWAALKREIDRLGA